MAIRAESREQDSGKCSLQKVDDTVAYCRPQGVIWYVGEDLSSDCRDKEHPPLAAVDGQESEEHDGIGGPDDDDPLWRQARGDPNLGRDEVGDRERYQGGGKIRLP